MASPLVFKIFRVAEWQHFAETGTFTGSSDDRRDGFIHLSSESQVAGTLDRHFASENEIVLAGFAEEALGAALRAEPSRDGALFPHLYGALKKAQVVAFARLSRGPRGFALPEWCGGR